MSENEKIISADSLKKTYFHDLYHFRELLLFFTWRDILVRYKQTLIGILWVFIKPFLTMVIFTIVFSKIAKLDADAGIPYALMVFAATLPWQFFSTSLTQGSQSLISNSAIISKIYFPRIIIPVSTVLSSLVDFFIAFIFLILLMIYYKFSPGIHMIFFPVFLVLTTLLSLGFGFIISALNVSYRDFRYIIPFMLQFGLYITPVGFSSSVIPQKYKLIFYLNPMAGIIDGFRCAVYGGFQDIYIPGLAISIALTIILFIAGFNIFIKLEKSFADKI